MVVSVSKKISKTGKSIESFISNIDVLQKLNVKELSTLAKQVSKDFSAVINASRKRKGQHDTDSLANAFTDSGVTILPDGSVSVGIGNIAELDKKYPYWKLVNYGGMGKVRRTMGYFGHGEAPDPALRGQGTQSFHYHSAKYSPLDPGTNYYLLKPGPIRAMNYIERVNSHLQARWTKLRDKYISALQK